MNTKVLTIMLTDIKGFTERTARSSRSDLSEMLKQHENILYPILKQFKGTLIKTIGDALLITFESPTNAVLCGIMMQESLAEFNKNKPVEEQIIIRIAINTGEVELKENDIFGEPVNITARIEGITEANEIYFTESVYLSMNKAEVPTSEVGYRILKGISEEIKVYRVILDRTSSDYRDLIVKLRKSSPSPSKPSSNKGKIMSMFFLILLILFFLFWIHYQSPKNRLMRIRETGNLKVALAMADQFLKDSPDSAEAVEAINWVIVKEIFSLLSEEKFLEAIKLIEERSDRYPMFGKDQQLQNLYHLLAKDYYEKQRYREAEEIYANLLKNYSEDEKICLSILEQFGYHSQTRNDDLRDPALLFLTKKYEKLPPLIADNLFNFFYQRSFRVETHSDYLAILIEKYPEAKKRVLKDLNDEKIYVRKVCYEICQKMSLWDDKKLFLYHLMNLTTLSTSYQKDVEIACEYFNKMAVLPDWKQKKSELGITSADFQDVVSLRYSNETAKQVFQTLLTGFSEEMMEVVKIRVYEIKHPMVRYFLYQIAEKLNQMDQIDLLRFHLQSLEEIDPVSQRYEYKIHFELAFDYFQRNKPQEKTVARIRKVNETLTSLLTQPEITKNDYLAKPIEEYSVKLKKFYE